MRENLTASVWRSRCAFKWKRSRTSDPIRRAYLVAAAVLIRFSALKAARGNLRCAAERFRANDSRTRCRESRGCSARDAAATQAPPATASHPASWRCRKLRRLQRREAAKRKERHIGDAVAGEIVDHRVVGTMRQIVVILHAGDTRRSAAFGDLLGRCIAQTDVTDEPLRCRSARTVSGASTDPSAGPWLNMRRRLAASSASIPGGADCRARRSSILRRRRPDSRSRPRRAAHRAS